MSLPFDMASTLWFDPYETLGVERDAKLSSIHLTYRFRLRSHIRKLYKNPTNNADAQREFQKIHQAYDVLIKKNELKESIKALMGGELYQLVECWEILLRTRIPTINNEMQQNKSPHDVITRRRWLELRKDPTQLEHLLYRVQPGWLIGIASCIQLLFDLILMVVSTHSQLPTVC